MAYLSSTVSDQSRQRLRRSDTTSLPRSSLPSASRNFPSTMVASISFSLPCNFWTSFVENCNPCQHPPLPARCSILAYL